MFVRNRLQAGDYAIVVPSGIKLTLQYSDRGALECVYVGHKDNQVLHPELLTPLLQSKEVPIHIPITKGTSYVYGCLYTDTICNVEGRLDNSVEVNYISEYLKDPSKFHFFAGHIQSYAIGMTVPISIQRWLKATGFNLLPSCVIPADFKDEVLFGPNYPFKSKSIQSLIVFRKGTYHFISTNLRQLVVKKINKYVSYDGWILADIIGHDIGSINVSFSTIVNNQIHVGSILVVDEENTIVECYNVEKFAAYSNQIKCEYCGRMLEVPHNDDRFRCSDTHCISIIIPRIHRMLSILGLPKIDNSVIESFGESQGNIISLPDILDLEQFSSYIINTDLPTVLYSVVPSSVIPRQSDWAVFCNKCNNSIESIQYYLQHPDNMMTDLKLDSAIYRRFHSWLLEPENMFDLVGIITHPKLTIVSIDKKFEGPPIFRNKSIYLTGKFSHGSFDELKSILSSYSATVYDKFNTAVDCVIVGGLHEDVSGDAIQKARSMRIPIFEESEFFETYKIDDDIFQNTHNL